MANLLPKAVEVECFQQATDNEVVSEDDNQEVRENFARYKEIAMKLAEHLDANTDSNHSQNEPDISMEESKPSRLENSCLFNGCASDSDSVNADSDSEEETMLNRLGNTLIVADKPHVWWTDIIGLEEAKVKLQAAIILPLKFAYLRTICWAPSKGILLYGPHGCGKTFLVQAIGTKAIESGTAFFSLSCMHFASNVLNELEALYIVRMLFKRAKAHALSIVFLDDVDWLFHINSDNFQANNVVKTELLYLMRSFNDDPERHILVLAATNKPWVLGDKFRKQFDRTVYVPLPEPAYVRTQMFKSNIGSTANILTEEDFTELGRLSRGCSASCIGTMVKTALMQPLLRIQNATHFRRVTGPSRTNPEKTVEDLLTPCSPGHPDAIQMSWTAVESNKLLKPTVTMADMVSAIPQKNSKRLTRDIESKIKLSKNSHSCCQIL